MLLWTMAKQYDASNVVVINFGDLDGDGTANEAGDPPTTRPQVAEYHFGCHAA